VALADRPGAAPRTRALLEELAPQAEPAVR
jgi:hypothetical protein